MTIEQQPIAKGELKGRAEGRAEGELKGRAEGELKGKAENVLAVLEVRGLVATAEHRARILDCRDVARLDRWPGAWEPAARSATGCSTPPKPRGS